MWAIAEAFIAYLCCKRRVPWQTVLACNIHLAQSTPDVGLVEILADTVSRSRARGSYVIAIKVGNIHAGAPGAHGDGQPDSDANNSAVKFERGFVD